MSVLFGDGKIACSSSEDDSNGRNSSKFNGGLSLIESEHEHGKSFFARKCMDSIYYFEGESEDKDSIDSSKLERFQILQHFYLEYYFLLKPKPDKLPTRADVDSFFESLKDHKCIDDNGANICHVAYLHKNFVVGFELVQKYPDLAVKGYVDAISNRNSGLVDVKRTTKKNYTGENILHMCIMHGDYNEAEKLLKHFEKIDISKLKTLLRGYAHGHFFGKSKLNAGSYPLHFAACSNNERMFDLIFNYYVNHLGLGSVFWRDNEGNTVYHLCVIHNLLDQSQHVLDKLAGAVINEIKRQYIEHYYQGGKSKQIEIKHIAKEFPEGYEAKDSELPQLYDENSMDAEDPILKDITFPMPPCKLKDKRLEFWVEDKTYKLVLRKKVFEVVNNDLLSPLTIAAYGDGKLIKKGDENYEEKRLKKKKLFQDFLEKLKRVHWTYGTSQYYHMNLYGLEIPYDRIRYKVRDGKEIEFKSAIQILCEMRSEECLLIPEIKDIIEQKWRKFGKPLFAIKCVGNLFITVLITFTAFFVNATPDLTSKALDYGAILSIDIIMSITGIILFFYSFDFYIFLRYRSSIRGLSIFDMWCSLLTLISYGIFSISKVVAYQQGNGNDFVPSVEEEALGLQYNRQDHWLQKLSISVCLLSAYTWILFFLIGFSSTGSFVLVIGRIFISNIPKWIVLFLVVVSAFSCAISVLTNIGDPDVYYGVRHIWFVAWNLIKQAFGIQNFNEMDAYEDYYFKFIPENLIWMLEIFQTLFQFVMTLLMLNLLIAMINDSYNDLTKNSEALLLLERYNIMQGLEIRYKMALSLYYRCASLFCRGDNERHRENNIQLEIWKLYTTVMPPLTVEETDDAVPDRMFERTHFDPEGFSNLKKKSMDVNRKEKIALLIIDGQNDFHDEIKSGDGNKSKDAKDSYHHRPSLEVPGSKADALRVAEMIRANLDDIHKVFLTKDTHEPYHIANAVFWKFECEQLNIASMNSLYAKNGTFFAEEAMKLRSKGWRIGFEFQPSNSIKKGNVIKAELHPRGNKVTLYVAGDKLILREKKTYDRFDTNYAEKWVVNIEEDKFLAENAAGVQLYIKPRNSDEKVFKWAKDYVELLKCQGKNELTLWPNHCIKVKCVLARSRKFWINLEKKGSAAREFEPIIGRINYPWFPVVTEADLMLAKGHDNPEPIKWTVNREFIKSHLAQILPVRNDIDVIEDKITEEEIDAVIKSAKCLVDKTIEIDADGFFVWDDELFESTWNDIKDCCKCENWVIKKSELAGVFPIKDTPDSPARFCMTKDVIRKAKLQIVNDFVSDGHDIVEPIQTALDEWYKKHVQTKEDLNKKIDIEDLKSKYIDVIEKGSNWRTDVYSALKAEVEVRRDPSTWFNYLKLGELKGYDRIIICGQASTHSVKEMVKDIVSEWNHRGRGRIYILKDGMSPLKSLTRNSQPELFDYCHEHGVVVTTTEKVFATIKEDLAKERKAAKEAEIYTGKLDLILRYLKTIESQVY